MRYLLDANVLIDADRDYYPLERVPEFWDWLLDLAAQGRVKVPIETFSEVTDGRGSLTEWVREHKAVLLEPTELDVEPVRRAVEDGYAPDLSDNELESLKADPFLIAYGLALAGEVTVVTTEHSKPTKHKGKPAHSRRLRRPQRAMHRHLPVATSPGLPHRLEACETQHVTTARLIGRGSDQPILGKPMGWVKRSARPSTVSGTDDLDEDLSGISPLPKSIRDKAHRTLPCRRKTDSRAMKRSARSPSPAKPTSARTAPLAAIRSASSRHHRRTAS